MDAETLRLLGGALLFVGISDIVLAQTVLKKAAKRPGRENMEKLAIPVIKVMGLLFACFGIALLVMN